jgi:release factor glutamine methyltransferase
MLEWATSYFEKRQIPDPRLSIEWLLAEVLQTKRLDLYLNFERPLSSAELSALRPLVKRRANHEPLQYIIGYSEFINAHIKVTPDVLIPRIETEQLVEMILHRHAAGSSFSVLDIGTGSGCIPIALKMERPEWDITALDVSPSALSIAKENAAENNTDIFFQQGNILEWEKMQFAQPFDLIVSNPPYILAEEKNLLEPQVKNHEPLLALFCESIETMYQNIIAFAYEHLDEEGDLYLEIHEHYSDTILSLFDSNRWAFSLERDYDDKPRFITASKQIIR